jgi:glyoxylase-like metal-dependent hydrolase (beta-lactamase superfamily II)
MPAFIETGKYRFEVIDTPGHHKDHVAFYEKNMGWIFTGDLYVTRRQAVAFKDENINDEINSIVKILGLDFDTILCGHSGIHKNGKEKLKAKLEFFLGIREQVNGLKRKGLSVEEINKCLFPKKNLWEFVSRGEWSTMNMVRTV